jgi:hypothetical protein
MTWGQPVIRGLSKPCKCGRDGCTVDQRADERPSAWRTRDFSGRACAIWWGNKYDPRIINNRCKGGRKTASLPKAEKSDRGEAGALVTSVAWLFTDSGRIKAQRAAHGIVVP